MGYHLFLLCFGTLLYLFIGGRHHHSLLGSESNIVQVEVKINGTAPIGVTDEDFICATLDWWPPEKCNYGNCPWGRASLLNLDLENKLFKKAIKAFSPLKIRMGGSLQDKVIYQTSDSECKPFVKNKSQMFSFSEGCLPLSRWDELNTFFNDTGAIVTFGLNALVGRKIKSDGLAVGAWNSTNAESLIRYTANKGYNIYGWELGNELCGLGVGARVDAHRYASDSITLQNLINEIYKDKETKPLVLAPGGFFDAEWFEEFTANANDSVQIITQHIYNLGPGVDTNLTNKILDPAILDSVSELFSSVKNVVTSSKTTIAAWVGESGGAYNSGHHLVTDAFVMGFWYLDQLGMSASYDTKTYCRQSLIGGNYGLLNTTTFAPNPDYYSALLWHRLMGKQVLSTKQLLVVPHLNDNLRAYAHCSKQSNGITLLVLNLDRKKTARVHATVESGLFSEESKNKTSTLIFNVAGSSITRTRKLNLPAAGITSNNNLREEYHLTSPDNDLHSQIVLLNGKPLIVNPSTYDIPALEPKTVKSLEPVVVGPLSIVFVHVPGVNIPACT